MAKLHPLIEAFCRTGRQLYRLVEEIPCPGEAPVQVIRELLRALRGEIPKEEGLRIARSAPLDGIDPNLAIVTLALWAHMVDDADRAMEMRALCKRAQDFRTPETPYEVWRIVSYLEMHSVYSSGNKRRAEEIYRETLRAAPLESAHRVFMLTEYATMLANMGRATELEHELEEAAAGRQDLARLFCGIRLIQSVETCRADDALALLQETARDQAFATVNAARIRMARALIALLKGEGPPADREEHALAPLEMLLARRPEEALACIRRQSTAWLEMYVTECAFVGFNLIRAELACGHAEAARRLLRIRRDIGNVHPFDDLFMARIALLSGRRDAAAGHFAVALKNAGRCRAEPRLDFELRLSCELSPGDLMWMVRAAGGSAGAPSGKARESETVPPEMPSPAQARGVARLVGRSPAMERVRHTVLQYAALDAPVLVTGETGTGKEEAARALHESGQRAGRPFVAVNCGAISESLLESELFGHERGAFTGAQRTRKGLFEEAGAGTVLLDEIGDIPPRLQVALLRVLEAGEVRPVGASRSRKVACRIVAATNADLDDLVARGAFRRDLLFRLRRLELYIPPLRERREDILSLADHFLCAGRSDSRRPALSDAFRVRLRSLEWTGNVRELRSTMERLRLLNSEKLAYEGSDLDAILAKPVTAEAGAPDAATGRPGAPAKAGGTASASPIAGSLRDGRTAMRRLDRLRGHFREHGKLTRAEIVRLSGVSGPTATADLKILLAEGYIERVTPSASRRSHYFRLRSGLPEAR